MCWHAEITRTPFFRSDFFNTRASVASRENLDV
jgi:hypothetical protein